MNCPAPERRPDQKALLLDFATNSFNGISHFNLLPDKGLRLCLDGASPSIYYERADRLLSAMRNRDRAMKLSLLRYLFVADATVLALAGVFLIFAPERIENLFGFRALPPSVHYLIGMWGCCLATLALGYLVAATNPVKHRLWADVGIARGAMECVLGVVYLAQGIVTFRQAGVGIVIAALMSIAYVALYPRAPRLVTVAPVSHKAASAS
jgi:hypothetical protein